MHSGATVKVHGELLDELIQEGHQTIPSQWIETDKKAHSKRPGFERAHEPELKSRLVACGHLEDAKDIRADSPTCATEGVNLKCSFAACTRLRIKCADLTNAYFTADPMDRLLLMTPPKGGLPGEGDNDYALAMNKPIYGTKDGGRRFYKTFRRRALAEGLVEIKLCRSMYTYRDNSNRHVVMAGAHVDDIYYGQPNRSLSTA